MRRKQDKNKIKQTNKQTNLKAVSLPCAGA
jgi:hypothetical protein